MPTISGALQRYRLENLDDQQLLLMSSFLVDYPFPKQLYPGALAALAHCRRIGPTVVLSDGDVVFQPRKIQRSGIWDAVEGRVLIYLHKEKMLEAVAHRYPAKHYVMVDDKVRILAAMKQSWGSKLTTIFPRQGHYAWMPRKSRNIQLPISPSRPSAPWRNAIFPRWRVNLAGYD